MANPDSIPGDTPRARRPHQSGPRNGNWRGGRSLASNGYVLIRVGVDHPLADVRGYAYEHRVVASQMVGRWLGPEEPVHHRDGDRRNNAPENLEACPSAAHHGVRHRTGGKAKRLPGEANPAISCACGCGEMFARYDDHGRPRLFVPGHNPSDTPMQAAILKALEEGPKRTAEIRCKTGQSACGVKVALSRMAKSGQIARRSPGLYALPECEG